MDLGSQREPVRRIHKHRLGMCQRSNPLAALGGIILQIGIAVTIANPVGDVDNTAGEIRVFLG
jgi:hypothetical protein